MGLIQIHHTDGRQESMALDTGMRLAEIRRVLTEKERMLDTDYFLNGNTKIEVFSEPEITLEELLDGEKVLCIGSGCAVRENMTFEEYMRAGNDEKIAFFRQSQITHGITVADNGFVRSFRHMYTLQEPPLTARETVNTKMESSYAFSETTRNMNLMSSDRASISFHAPYVNAKAEYEHEKSKSVSTAKIKEYLLSKFIVSQASFAVDPSRIAVNMDFFNDVSAAVYSDRPAHQRTADLVMVLNRWGFYIPLEFAMGGALYTSDEKQITEFKQTQRDQENFSAAADAAFCGFGGGFDYSGSSQKEEEEYEKEEFKNLTVSQIGGTPGKIESKTDFADSLKDMAVWEMVDIRKFYPSIMLLRNVKVNGKKTAVLKDVLGLFNENHYIGAVKKLQPYIDILAYATSAEALVSPF